MITAYAKLLLACLALWMLVMMQPEISEAANIPTARKRQQILLQSKGTHKGSDKCTSQQAELRKFLELPTYNIGAYLCRGPDFNTCDDKTSNASDFCSNSSLGHRVSVNLLIPILCFTFALVWLFS